MNMPPDEKQSSGHVVFTTLFGQSPIYTYGVETIKRYAERIGVDCVVSRESSVFDKSGTTIVPPAVVPFAEKLLVKELLKRYDRVLFLDADVLVAPYAPDLFENFPDTSFDYLLNEAPYRNHARQIDLICRCFDWEGTWPEKEGIKTQYNAGVMLFSRGNRTTDGWSVTELVKASAATHPFMDQPYLNYCIQRDNAPVRELPLAYNFLPVTKKVSARRTANFIHHAGCGFGPPGERLWAFMSDYRYLARLGSWEIPSSTLHRLKTLSVVLRHPRFFLRPKKGVGQQRVRRDVPST